MSIDTRAGSVHSAWTIRNVLTTTVALLSLFCFCLSGYVLYQASAERATALQAASTNETADLLLSAAGNWARERGAVNLALNAPSLPSPAQLDTISASRRAADQSFNDALVRVAAQSFAGRDQLIAASKQASEQATILRRKVDQELGRSEKDRDTSVTRSWAPTLTGLIVASQNLRTAAAMEHDDVQTQLSNLQNYKHSLWVISEYLGRERAAISALIAASKPMAIDDINSLALSRGRVEAAWEYVQAYGAKTAAPEDLRKGTMALQASVFTQFEETRKSLIAAGIGGKPYPMSPSQWFTSATAAIDDVMALSAMASREAASLANSAKSTSTFVLLVNAALMAASLALAVITLWVVVKRVTRSLQQMTVAMAYLADGDLTINVPCRDRRDELGAMAHAMDVFKDSMNKTRQLETEQKVEEERRVARTAAIESYVSQFDKSVASVLQMVSSASTELESTAQSMSATAEETSRQATAVAAASGEAASNVQTAASGAEELAASVSEISRQVTRSAGIANKAMSEADGTNQRMRSLAEAAQKIGDVVKFISEIANQTNLLALNATIEAARAGEAGKGFAVVASEVKALAAQTAKATSEISGKITEMQSATDQSSEAIGAITGTISQINEIAAAIASAVEEQGAATREIARNVQEASTGTREVSSNIDGVTRAADDTGAAASQVLAASVQLSKQSEALRAMVDGFLQNIRTA